MTSRIETKLRRIPSEYVTDADLAALLPGSENSQHAQIKRSVARGYLIRVRRGLYCLGDYLIRYKPHPYELAQRIYSPSYVSLESALAYHGLIPEAVYTITSVTPRRAKLFKTPYGFFDYLTLPEANFFVGVERIEEKPHIFLLATPWKAIMDYVYCYKKTWTTVTPLVESLRIELDELPKLNQSELEQLQAFYQSKRVDNFVGGVMKELL